MTRPARRSGSLPTGNHSSVAPARDRSEQLASALDQFASLRSSGECVRPEDFIAKFPEIADELEDYLPLIEWLTLDSQPAAAALESASQLGASIGGYGIVRQVGKGGMGTVYEAWDVSLQRRVALKVLANHLMLDPNSIARFHNEARAVAQLDHPHIVPVLDSGSDGDSHYYSMRFIQGCTLSQIFQRMRYDESIAQRSPSTLVELSMLAETFRTSGDRPSEGGSEDTHPLESSSFSHAKPDTLPQLAHDYFWLVAKLGEQAADALHYAHQQGVIHRDIKPSNVMLDHRGHLWITDFGLAKIESNASLTMTGELVGTLRYMSPEQARLSPGIVDQRSDVYSLGATLYEMATLRAPIAGASREELVAGLLHGIPTHPRRLQGNLPKDLETILLKALEKNLADRYPSARALADDLRRFSERRPIVARRSGWGLRLLRLSQRNPKLTAVSVALVMFMLLTLAVSAWWADANYRQTVFERTLRQQQERAAQQAQQHVLAQEAASLTIQAAAVWRSCDFSGLHELMAQSQSTPEHTSLPRRILRQIDESRPAVLAQHQGQAFSVSLSPDQALVASSGEDGVRIHRRETGELLCHLRHHEGDVNGIAWSKDGRLLASAGDDGQLFIYSTTDWQVIGKRRVTGALVSAQFSLPLGVVVACERDSLSRGNNYLHVWELADETKHQTLSGPKGVSEGLSLSSDGKLAAVACRDGIVYVFDLERLELSRRLFVNALDAEKADVSAVAFANNSTLLASCSRDGSIRIFDALSGQAVPFPPSTFEFAESIAFSSDDQLLAVGVRRGLTQVFLRRSSGRWVSISEFKHEQGLWSLGFSKDNLIYAAGSKGRIEYWDCALPMERRLIKLLPAELSCAVEVDHSPKVRASNWKPSRDYERAVAFQQRDINPRDPFEECVMIEALATAKRLIVTSVLNRSLQILDSTTGAPILEHFQGGPYSTKPVLSDDESQMLLASHPNEFALANAQTLETLRAGQHPLSGLIAGAAFSSDRSRLYVALKALPRKFYSGQSVFAYDTANLEQVALSPAFPSLALEKPPAYTSRAIRFLVERSDNPLARAVWNEISLGQVTWVGCSDAEDIFVCANNRSGLRIFRANDWEHPTRVPLVDGPGAFAMSPDGTLIAASAPTMLRLFDTVTGRELLSLRHYMQGPWDVCFSKDGRQLMLIGQGFSNVLELAIWGDENPS